MPEEKPETENDGKGEDTGSEGTNSEEGGRGVQIGFWGKVWEVIVDAWCSRSLLILVIVIMSSMLFAVNLYLSFSSSYVNMSVQKDQVREIKSIVKKGEKIPKVDDVVVSIPVPKDFFGIICHFIMAILSIRCMVLQLRETSTSFTFMPQR